jgi:hypothetical protein
MDINKISSILASEIECSVFETHVQPALEVVRKVFVGWKLVPHEPTKEMIDAGLEQWHRIGTTEDAWQAMYCAAPENPAESD